MLPLRVNPEGLRSASGQLEALASGMATIGSTPETSSSWLATSAAASSAHADAKAARAVLTERMRATSQKLAIAGIAYVNTDARLAAELVGTTGPGTN